MSKANSNKPKIKRIEWKFIAKIERKSNTKIITKIQNEITCSGSNE